MKIWIDIKNSHEPLFFKSLEIGLEDEEIFYSCREFAEVIPLLKKYDFDFSIIGNRPEGNMIKRILGFYGRVFQLYTQVPDFDFSINHMSIWAVYVSFLRRRKNITIGDNDIDHLLNRRMFKYVDYFLSPSSINPQVLINDNLSPNKLIQFDGFKEDIYIADYSPDLDFLKSLPFDDFVTIRPESLQATYLPKGIKSIVPELLGIFTKNGMNVLYLPRYDSDNSYAEGYENVFIPQNPLNGLDVCYYSKAVITGAGTFAREAACMGTPSVSFFPGTKLLGVDSKMISDEWMLHSRNPIEIFQYVNSVKGKRAKLDRSKKVKSEVLKIIKNLIAK